MINEKVICPLCGLICGDLIAQVNHKIKDHFDWYACEQRVKMLQDLTIPQLEARQKAIDKFKKEKKKK